MGRALKIQKFGVNNGITINANGTINQPALSTAVDLGYPNFASLTNPVYDNPNTLTSTNFLGVVGGSPTTSTASATYPEILATVNITLADATSTGAGNGRIIRQKGVRKFLVTSSGHDVQDESMVVGAAYMIGSLDTTDWQQMGAPAGAIVGTIFTCTAVCADPKNGYGWLVGQCVLKNQSSPSVGNMNISMAVGGDSTAVYVSKLTNRFAQDFHGGETGGNASTGDVWNPTQVVNNIDYAANFFTDTSTFAKSGAEVNTWTLANGSDQPGHNGTLELAQVEKYTS